MTVHAQRRQRLLAVINQWMRRNRIWFVLVLVLSVPPSDRAMAAETKLVDVLSSGSKVTAKPAIKPVLKEEKKDDTKKIEKNLSGTVSYIHAGKMVIEFSPGEEIFLTVDKDVKVSHVKSYKEIARGDRVSVKYTEVSREPKGKAAARTVLSMTVKEISLEKKAKPEELVS
jgi:hypothetical protein